METTIANYTLPAVCHVVCTLLATGISTGINVTNPDSSVNQPQTFPEGYVAHPDVGFAYKVHDRIVSTAIEATRGCMKEGARLALIDSPKKLEYVMLQKQSGRFAYVGIFRMYGGTTWAAAGTGLPVSFIPWATGYGARGGSMDCAYIDFSLNGLTDYGCSDSENYACELPILNKNTLAAN